MANRSRLLFAIAVLGTFLGSAAYGFRMVNVAVGACSSYSAPIASYDGGTQGIPRWVLIQDGDSITAEVSHTNYDASEVEEPTATYSYISLPFVGQNVNVTNIALSGEHCTAMVANQPSVVAPLVVSGRTVISLLCGANDIIGGGQTAAQVWTTMQTYASNSHSYGAKVCIFTIPTVQTWNVIISDPGMWAPIGEALNATIRSSWQGVFDCMGDFAAGYSAGWTMDQLHPNPDGFAHMANIYWPSLLPVYRSLGATQ